MEFKSLKPKGYAEEIREIERSLKIYAREREAYYRALAEHPKHHNLNRFAASANTALDHAKKKIEKTLELMNQSRKEIQQPQKNRIEELLKQVNRNIAERNKMRTREAFRNEGNEKIKQIRKGNEKAKFRKILRTKSAYGLGPHLIGRMKSVSKRKRRP